jgi:hypothetical protein
VTEAEWLACTDPQKMLDFLRGKASDRKLRLFAVARCRQLWHLLTDHRSQRAIEVAERFADRQATKAELGQAAVAARQVEAWPDRVRVNEVGARVAISAVVENDPIGNGVWDTAWDLGGDNSDMDALMAAASKEPSILRDIFDNAFRPVNVDAGWLTPSVVELARTIYDDRTFDRMPQLADALEQAGCTNADILAHCR